MKTVAAKGIQAAATMEIIQLSTINHSNRGSQSSEGLPKSGRTDAS